MTSILQLKAKNRPDDFQTPDWPVEYLFQFLLLNSPKLFENPHIKLWEPAQGKGNIVRYLNKIGIKTFGTDIQTGTDFLKDKAPESFDAIITNPPYSIKDKFLQRCYDLEVPFALLLPLTSFEGVDRQAMYAQYGAQFLILPRRVNFETPSGKGRGSWFATMWVTNGFGLQKDLYFL